MSERDAYTHVNIKTGTKARLESVKETKGCTYDTLINCLLNNVDLEDVEMPQDYHYKETANQIGSSKERRKIPEVTEIIRGLESDNEIREAAIKLCKCAYGKDMFLRKQPESVAAACIYAASLLSQNRPNYKQSYIQEITGVTPTTIRETYQPLIDECVTEEGTAHLSDSKN